MKRAGRGGAKEGERKGVMKRYREEETDSATGRQERKEDWGENK